VTDRRAKATCNILYACARVDQFRERLHLVHRVHGEALHILRETGFQSVFLGAQHARRGVVAGDTALLGEELEGAEPPSAGGDGVATVFTGDDGEVLEQAVRFDGGGERFDIDALVRVPDVAFVNAEFAQGNE